MPNDAIPSDLLHVPGFVAEVMDYMLDTAPRPSPHLAFGGALSLLAHLAGGKIRTERNHRTNLYIALIATYGDGVLHPGAVIQRILAAIGRKDTVCGAYASREAVEKTVARHRASIFLPDSFANYLTRPVWTVTDQEMAEALLALHTAARASYRCRQSGPAIDQPCLNLFSNARQRVLQAVLQQGGPENALFARFLFIIAPVSGRNARPSRQDVPESILAAARLWDARPHKPRVAIQTAEAEAMMGDWLRKVAAIHNRHADTAGDKPLAAVWARAEEHAEKLAMVYAASVDPKHLIIDAGAVRWATALVDHLLTGIERRIVEARSVPAEA